MKETFVGDTVKITLDTKIDVSTYPVLIIRYRKPSGEEGIWTATIGATNLKISYTTSPTDLDEAGVWSIQAHVSDVPGTAILRGKVVNFMVYNFIPAPIP